MPSHASRLASLAPLRPRVHAGVVSVGRAALALAAAAVPLLAAAPATAPAQGCEVEPLPLALEPVAAGFALPVVIAAAPGDGERLFVGELHTGRVRIVELATGTVKPEPFLEIDGVAISNGQGLLGLAFDPEYATNGFVYASWVREAGAFDRTVVARFVASADPDVAEPGPVDVLLELEQPFFDHNGGWIGFGPDGYLYLAIGDGGGAGDPNGRAQDVTDELLGKVLRIDPHGDDYPADPLRNYSIPPDNPLVGVEGDDEIWHWGVRSPWRCALDRVTGELWIADVGHENVEEIHVTAPDAGGQNLGWRCREGTLCFDPTCCDAPELTPPLWTYPHGVAPLRCAIIGGLPYRGAAIPGLVGRYVFADWCSGAIFVLERDGAGGVQVRERTADLTPPSGPLSSIVTFGEDAAGELYLASLGTGTVWRIVPGSAPPGVALCFGIGCPCGNDVADAGCASSTGAGARLDGCGTASVAADDLELVASALPPGANAILFMGDGYEVVTLSDGLRCSRGTAWRFECCIPAADAAGVARFGPGLAARSAGLVVPGLAWTFQAWYRDAGGPCGTGGNLTSAYAVSFGP